MGLDGGIGNGGVSPLCPWQRPCGWQGPGQLSPARARGWQSVGLASRPRASDPRGKQPQQRDLSGCRRHQSWAEPPLCQWVPGQEGSPQARGPRWAPGTDTSCPYRKDGSTHVEPLLPPKLRDPRQWGAGGTVSGGVEGVNHDSASSSRHKNVSDLPLLPSPGYSRGGQESREASPRPAPLLVSARSLGRPWAAICPGEALRAQPPHMAAAMLRQPSLPALAPARCRVWGCLCHGGEGPG